MILVQPYDKDAIRWYYSLESDVAPTEPQGNAMQEVLNTYMIYIYYMTKPVTLSDEAYRELSKMKSKDLSFSDVVMKLVERNKNTPDFKSFSGVLREEHQELESFKKNIMEDRKQNTDVK